MFLQCANACARQSWGLHLAGHLRTKNVNCKLNVRISSPAKIHLQENALFSCAVHAHSLYADWCVTELQLPETDLLPAGWLHAVKDRLTDLLKENKGIAALLLNALLLRELPVAANQAWKG
jgi:hypothetical protein